MQPYNDTPFEPIIFIGAFLVLISIFASRMSARLGVPALLLFLFIGMLAGSEGPGGIHFDDPNVARSIGVVALALILFAGGLDTKWGEVRPILRQGMGLSTFGVLFTSLLLGWFVSIVTPFSFLEGMLVGSIVSSTDAAAVFAVLRSRNVSLRGSLRPLLELESGSNDPMAVFLTMGLVGLMADPTSSIADLVPMFVRQMLLGALVGYGAGKAMVYITNHLRLEYEGLYPVLTLAVLLLVYSLTSMVGGNGFLAAYVAGIMMGNSDFIHKRSLTRFHDGLAWLMQITMFLTLGLLVFPSQLLPVAGVGFLVAAFLMFVARPASTFLTLALAKMNMRDKTLVSWVGLRGAVPIILATFPLLAGIEQADMIFNLVFFTVLTSALVQGTSIPRVAKWLRVNAPLPEHVTARYDMGSEECIICKLNEVRISDDSILAGKQIVDAKLPEKADVLLLNRNREIIATTGATILQPGDVLLVLADEDSLDRLKILAQPQQPTENHYE
jgi:cell volume regulation protein A